MSTRIEGRTARRSVPATLGLVDGSVRLLPYSTGEQTFAALGTRDGREVVGEF